MSRKQPEGPGGVEGGPSVPHRKLRRAGRYALFAAPVVAVAVIVMLATGVLSTLAQFTASITNDQNHAETGSVGLSEVHDGVTCSTQENGQWFECSTINKYADGGQTVTLTNTGSVAAQLSLLPSACTDTQEGAGGPLCALVSVTVSCKIPPTNSVATTFVSDKTLNDFAAGARPPAMPFPTGYAVGTLQPGESASCTFTLAGESSIPAGEGVSQPLAWKLS